MSTKRKPPTSLAKPVVKQSAKPPTKSRIDESRTTVSSRPGGGDTSGKPIEISSDSSSSVGDYSDLDMDADEEDGDQEDADPRAAAGLGQSDPLAQNLQNSKTTPPPETDAPAPRKRDRLAAAAQPSLQHSASQDPDTDASDAEAAEPTFGDLLRSHETIDVSASLLAAQQHQQQSTTLATPNSHAAALAPPTLSSLGTVLNQALRTDDTQLLESCLSTTDLTTVRATIQRMDSALAGALLTKLAARMHRRPGRAHSLMSWIQWTLIAHGGALAAQPDVARRLDQLNRVLDERARSLTSLLALKGKLDMLEAQMQLRRERRLPGAGRGQEGHLDSQDEASSDPDEPGMIYVEGQGAVVGGGGAVSALEGQEDDEDYPVTNGIAGASDSEEEEDMDNDDDGMEVDNDGAAAQESLDEDEVDHDDDDSLDEDDSEVEVDVAAPPAKLQKTAKGFSKRR